MGLTKISGEVLQQPINIGVVTATSVSVGSAVTIHSGGINVTGVTTSSGGFVGNVTGNATGLSGTPNVTVGTIGATSLNASGIVTASSFSGDGTNLTNTGSTLSAGSGSQRVVLTSQTSGTMTASATNSSLAFNSSTGALSATSFSGDGSTLTGIAVTTNVRTDSLVVSGVSTFSGITTVTGTTLFAKQLNVSGVTTFSSGSTSNPSVAIGDTISGLYALSGNRGVGIAISASSVPAISIKRNTTQEIHHGYRNQVCINGDTNGALFATTGGTEVFRVQSFAESTSGTNYGSVFSHSENGYKPSQTSYAMWVETRGFGYDYAVCGRQAGNGAAGWFYSGGGPYSEGNGVYARVDHSDSNGPGWQAGVYAYGATIGGPAIGAGGAGALHAIVNNHYNSDPVIKCESQYSGSPTRTAVQFIRNNSNVGSITFTLSATAYNTSSDYRLKENIVPLENAEQRLRQIPVHRFNFIQDPNKTVDGFIAHEVESYVPEAVQGDKDAMETIVVKDEDGKDTFNEDGTPILKTVPKYQGIDQSKLVPLLTASLQEAFDKIDHLETRVAILESL